MTDEDLNYLLDLIEVGSETQYRFIMHNILDDY